MLDWLLFVPLAVLTNTAFPMPFDPVLLYYASRHSFEVAFGLALVGSLCAGLGGWVDLELARPLRKVIPEHWLRWMPCWGGWSFYLCTIVFAILPLPFSVVRVLALKEAPDPALYGAAIALGRLPRYLLTVYLCQTLEIPVWVTASLLVLAFTFGAATWLRSSQPITVSSSRPTLPI